jgi:hypothetical protein
MAQTQINMRKAQIHVEEESALDTYLAPSAGGTAFLATDVTISYDSSNYDPQVMRADGLSHDEIPGPIAATLNFTVPLKGSGVGTMDGPPSIAEALKSAGLVETVNASTNVTYVKGSLHDGLGGNPGPSYSYTILHSGPVVGAGTRMALKGGFANIVLNGSLENVGLLSFTAQGSFVPYLDAVPFAAPGYDDTIPPAFRSASFSTNFGGAYTPKGVETFVLDWGQNVVVGRDINEATGIYGARIVAGGRASGSFNPERQTIADSGAIGDYSALQRAGTAGSITTGVIGSTAGNRYAVTVARAVLRPITPGDRNGISILDVPFSVSSANTDVEGTNPDISLVFT